MEEVFACLGGIKVRGGGEGGTIAIAVVCPSGPRVGKGGTGYDGDVGIGMKGESGRDFIDVDEFKNETFLEGGIPLIANFYANGIGARVGFKIERDDS